MIVTAQIVTAHLVISVLTGAAIWPETEIVKKIGNHLKTNKVSESGILVAKTLVIIVLCQTWFLVGPYFIVRTIAKVTVGFGSGIWSLFIHLVLVPLQKRQEARLAADEAAPLEFPKARIHSKKKL
jgi:hypothetical protein